MINAVALLGFGSVSAGQLSDDAARAASAGQPGEKIRVWITLPAVQEMVQLKATAKASASTRAGRYGYALGQLKTTHGESQRNLVNHLQSLKLSDRVANVKPHWIVNVVEADIAAGELVALAKRNDIETIMLQPEVTSILPDQTGTVTTSTAAVESNLTYINAPAAWAAGYTGRGRVVCIIDTGVDGAHPALFDNWKGHDGDSAAAWFDPVDGEPFPHIVGTGGGTLIGHGTHVTGIAVGHDDAGGDTVGVALDANWIAAASVDIPGASIIDAFEWAANPDGDPNTLHDVPDVISNSWGVANIGCQNIFFDMIDAAEALGIVVVFSAGNDGIGGASFTIRNPANRALDSLDCFAVGNFDHVLGVLASNSSRGPSDCDGISIKPNVVAPGTVIRSTWPGGIYNQLSGASMSTPHVAGLVALLRQKNPNATVDEVKEAILTSTRNLGLNLPNNDYGWGVIDCMAALNALSDDNDDPNVRVYAFEHEPISPGDTVDGRLVLQNLGADLRNVSAFLTDDNPSLTVLNGFSVFGDIAEGDTAGTPDQVSVIVSDTVTPGSILSADLLVTNSTGYAPTLKLYFVVAPGHSRSFVTHDAGDIELTVSNFGTIGLGEGSIFPAGGIGVIHRDGEQENNDLFDGGLMIGRDASHVSDGVSNVAAEPDGDFGVTPDGNIAFVTPLSPAAQQSRCRFDDDRAENPMGVSLFQTGYAFDTAPYDDIVILQYFITNTSGAPLNNLYMGFHLDWDISFYSDNIGGYDAGGDYLWMAYRSEGNNYRGIKLVDGSTFTAYTDLAANVVYVPDGVTQDGYTELEKMNSLARGISSPSIYETEGNDLFQVMATRMTLEAGQTDTVAFALLAGQNAAALIAAAAASQTAYDLILAANVAPEISPIASITVVAGTDISFPVNAIDPNGTTPSLRAENLPAGASFDDNGDGSGSFTWAGASQQAGQFVVSFVAEDATLSDTETAAITVLEAGAVPPVIQVLSAPELLVIGGETISFTVLASDLNGTTPALTTGDLPAGATFTDNGDGSGTFGWPTGGVEEGSYELLFIAADGVFEDSSTVSVTISGSLPTSYALYQNFPNPFNAGTTIRFALGHRAWYTLAIYNVAGRKVYEVTDIDGPGEVLLPFTGEGLASGVYFYRLTAGPLEQSRKMMLVR